MVYAGLRGHTTCVQGLFTRIYADTPGVSVDGLRGLTRTQFACTLPVYADLRGRNLLPMLVFHTLCLGGAVGLRGFTRTPN